MVCEPCPPPFAGRFSGVCGRCCLNESLSSFVLHVLRLSSTEVLRFAIVFSSSLILFDSHCSLSLASSLSFSRVWVKASIFGKAVRTFSSSVIFEYMRFSLSLASVLSRSSESCKPSIFDKSVCRAVTGSGRCVDSLTWSALRSPSCPVESSSSFCGNVYLFIFRNAALISIPVLLFCNPG